MPQSLRRICVRLFFPIVLATCGFPAFSQVIDAGKCDSVVHLVITPYASFLQTEQPVSIDSALKSASRFHKPFEKAVSGGNYDPYYYWFRIVVDNSQDKPRDLILLMAPLGMYDGRLLQRIDGKWTEVAHAGLKYRFYDRSYQFTHHVFPFTTPPKTLDTLYFSIDARNAFKLFGFALFQPKQFRIFEATSYFVFGIIVGLLLLFFVLNVSLFFALKQRIHLWYALYIFLVFLAIMKNDQLDQQFLGLDSEKAFRLTPYATIGAFAIVVLLQVVQQFLRKVLNENRTLYNISKGLKINAISSAIAHAIVFFSANNVHLENIVFSWTKISILLCILMVMVNCVYGYLNNVKEALFLLLGSFVFLVGSFQRLFFADSLSFLFPPTILHMGIILEVFIISLALIYRYWFEKRKERTEREKIRIETINVISAEVHDYIAPTLILANVNLTRIDFSQPGSVQEKVSAAEHLTDIAQSNIRDLARTIKEGPTLERELPEQVRKECLELEKTYGIIAVCEIQGVVKLNNHQQAEFVRIIREAFNNAMKHARTPTVEVLLVAEEGLFTLTIRDQGVGFDFDTVFPRSNGLKNIYWRSRVMNASCHIESAPGKGTVILIKLPISPKIS